MKKCPNCQQVFDDSNDFCLNDGTPLVVLPSGSYDTPTQVFRTPHHSRSTAVRSPVSPILYLVIGVLGAAFVAAMIFIFAMPRSGDGSEKTAVATSNNSRVDPAKDPAQPSNQRVGAAANTPGLPITETRNSASTSSRPTDVPYVSPTGTWQGQWTNGKGSAFGQVFTLVDEGNGRISGQIVHTLQQTINPQKMGKIGLTAVEYVQGNYDPNTRIITLSGIRKTDPNDLIILDKYRLSISANSSVVAGETVGGKSRGQISLRR